jgi:hypothetical protein
MEKKTIKWIATLSSTGIITSALICANIANANNLPNTPNNTSMNMPTPSLGGNLGNNSAMGSAMGGAIANIGKGLLNFGNNTFQKFLEIFAYPNSDYIKYLEQKVVPDVSNTTLLPSLISKQVNADTNLYLKNTLWSNDSSFQGLSNIPQTAAQAQQFAGSFNIGSILNYSTLTDQQQKNAKTYLAFASGAIMPFQTQGILGLQKGTGATNSFLGELGIYAAQLSPSANALFGLYEERLPQQTLGNISPLEYEMNMINSRSQPDWYNRITSQNFTPADAARESLILQQLQLREAFLLRMQIENLIAITAIQQQTIVQTAVKPRLSAALSAALNQTSAS